MLSVWSSSRNYLASITAVTQAPFRRALLSIELTARRLVCFVSEWVQSSDAGNDHTQSRKSLYKNILLLITGSMREKKLLFMFLLSKTDQLFTHWATLFISVASLIDAWWVLRRLRQKNLPILTFLMPHQTPEWLMSPERRWEHNFVCVCNKTVTYGNQKKLSATLFFFSLLLIIFIASSLTSSRLLLEF